MDQLRQYFDTTVLFCIYIEATQDLIGYCNHNDFKDFQNLLEYLDLNKSVVEAMESFNKKFRLIFDVNGITLDETGKEVSVKKENTYTLQELPPFLYVVASSKLKALKKAIPLDYFSINKSDHYQKVSFCIFLYIYHASKLHIYLSHRLMENSVK
ncbi:hypothetical protein ACKWTF_000324 [Chironomus riparius]